MGAAKERLNELCRQRKLPTPTFKTKAVEGGFSSVAKVKVTDKLALKVDVSMASTQELAEEGAAEAVLQRYAEKPDIWWAVARSTGPSTVQMLQEICQKMGFPVPVYRSRGRDRNWWGSCKASIAGREIYMEGRGAYPRDISHVLAGKVLQDLGWVKAITPRSGQGAVDIIDPSRHQRSRHQRR